MKELIIIQSRLKAPKSQYNSFGKYKYRNCEDILEAVKPLLKEQECTLTISDEIVMIGTRYYIKATATIKNSNGEQEISVAYAREEESKKGMDSSQVTGAASSYARKYALNGIFCIDDTKDSDSDSLSMALKEIEESVSVEALKSVYNKYNVFQNDGIFMKALSNKKGKLLGKES